MKERSMSEKLSFTQTMSELGLGRDELENLAASGELRGIHEGGDVYFKSEEVAALKRSRETEPTVVLSESEASPLEFGEESPIDLDSISTDETVLNIEGLLEDDAEGTTPVPGMGILEGDDLDVGAIGEDTVLDTDGLDLDDDFDLGSDDDTVAAGVEQTFIAGGGTQRMQMVQKRGSPGMTALLAVTLLAMLGPAAVVLNLIGAQGGAYPKWVEDSGLTALNSAVEAIVGMF
jgi:hypothetical protein